jgi:hypothetical protein
MGTRPGGGSTRRDAGRGLPKGHLGKRAQAIAQARNTCPDEGFAVVTSMVVDPTAAQGTFSTFSRYDHMGTRLTG